MDCWGPGGTRETRGIWDQILAKNLSVTSWARPKAMTKAVSGRFPGEAALLAPGCSTASAMRSGGVGLRLASSAPTQVSLLAQAPPSRSLFTGFPGQAEGFLFGEGDSLQANFLHRLSSQYFTTLTPSLSCPALVHQTAGSCGWPPGPGEDPDPTSS